MNNNIKTQLDTYNQRHCPECKAYVELDGFDCRGCGRRLIKESSTADKLADLERAGYITN